MTAPATLWAVTELAHPALRDVREDCADCLALTDAAIVAATVTGSTGATSTRQKVDGQSYSVTVARAVCVTRRGGESSGSTITAATSDTFDPVAVTVEQREALAFRLGATVLPSRRVLTAEQSRAAVDLVIDSLPAVSR